MAGMDQKDFKSGTIRNSLRCIPATENSSKFDVTCASQEDPSIMTDIRTGGGQQLGAFIAGTGNGLKGRTCDGPLQDGDTYKVEFNYDGADKR